MKNLFTGLILLVSVYSYCQDAPGRFSIHLTGYRITSTEFNRDLAIGVIGEYHFNDHLSSLFPLSFSNQYFQIGLGTMFAPLGMASLESGTEQSFSGFLGQLFAIATAFESLGYRVKLGEDKEIVPFYSLFRITGVGNNVVKAGENAYVSGSLGVMFRYGFTDRFHLNGYGELSHYYGVKRSKGLQTGISVGYAFGKRSKD